MKQENIEQTVGVLLLGSALAMADSRPRAKSHRAKSSPGTKAYRKKRNRQNKIAKASRKRNR